jgi:ubiquinone/menaquinone biosynthesis C-methylase UbiE
MTDPKSKINYHLQELQIARDSGLGSHILPDFSENDHVILDIGCGIGQTLCATRQRGNNKLLVGLDIDHTSLEYGRLQFSYIEFVNGGAEFLPFRDSSFDLVISRVSLPYTNIPRALSEIRRVLKQEGKVWFTLHPFSTLRKDLKNSVLHLNFRDVLFRFYVLTNGIVFHFSGRQFALPFTEKYESFQSEAGIVRALINAGFKNYTVQNGRHFVVTAQRGA